MKKTIYQQIRKPMPLPTRMEIDQKAEGMKRLCRLGGAKGYKVVQKMIRVMDPHDLD